MIFGHELLFYEFQVKRFFSCSLLLLFELAESDGFSSQAGGAEVNSETTCLLLNDVEGQDFSDAGSVFLVPLHAQIVYVAERLNAGVRRHSYADLWDLVGTDALLEGCLLFKVERSLHCCHLI